MVLDRKTQAELDSATIRDLINCGLCKRQYRHLEHLTIGRVGGGGIVFACSQCACKLTETMGVGIAPRGADSSSAEYSAVFSAHPVFKKN